MKDLPPSRTADQFQVRFPDGLRDRIAEAAKINNRSMNAEIIARLTESFEKVEALHEVAGNLRTSADSLNGMAATLRQIQLTAAAVLENAQALSAMNEDLSTMRAVLHGDADKISKKRKG